MDDKYYRSEQQGIRTTQGLEKKETGKSLKDGQNTKRYLNHIGIHS